MAYNAFAVTPNNNSGCDNDASGAFLPGAKFFARAFNGRYKSFINANKQSKKNFLATIENDPGGLDIFAYFGHGWKQQLGSAEIYTKQDIKDLASILKFKLKPGATICLYACYAGFKGGFSQKLQDELPFNVWIYGHTTKGHSFANPDVSEVIGQLYSYMYPQDNPLRNAWAAALLYTDLWVRFPLMNYGCIENELNAVRLLGIWKINNSANKTYTFKWSKQDNVYNTIEDISKNPTGSITSSTGETGRWEIKESVVISWTSSESETWEMPVNPKSQKVRIGNDYFNAVRIKNFAPGKLHI